MQIKQRGGGEASEKYREKERKKERRKEGRKYEGYFGRKTKLREVRLFLAHVDSCKFLESIGTRARSPPRPRRKLHTILFCTPIRTYVRVCARTLSRTKELKNKKREKIGIASLYRLPLAKITKQNVLFIIAMDSHAPRGRICELFAFHLKMSSNCTYFESCLYFIS